MSRTARIDDCMGSRYGLNESSSSPSRVSCFDIFIVRSIACPVPLVTANSTFQLSPASLKVMDTCAASSSLDGPMAISEYSRAVPSCMFVPTSQMSSSVGGFRKDGPGPENPPPAAMMPTLTLMPTTANTAVMITTCRFGDTALIGCQWLYIDYFSVTSGVTYSPIWLYIFRNLLPLSVVL